MSTTLKHEYGFDILRVLSMLYIIALYHIDDYAEDIFTNPLTTVLVKIALSTFIFISGYILTSKYKSFASKKEIKSFLIKRIMRIYPLYLFALLLFFIVGLISLEAFISGVFLVNVFLDIYVLTFWFISLIFIYYILFVFIIYNYSFVRLVITYISINIILFIIHKYSGYVSSQLFYYMPSFFLGILFSKYQYLREISKNRFFLLALVFFSSIFVYMRVEFVPMSFIAVIASIPFIYLFSQSFDHHNRFIERVSYASFTMYILHRLIYEMLLGIYNPTSNVLTILYLLVIGLPLLYIISFNIQSLYDTIMTKMIVSLYAKEDIR